MNPGMNATSSPRRSAEAARSYTHSPPTRTTRTEDHWSEMALAPNMAAAMSATMPISMPIGDRTTIAPPETGGFTAPRSPRCPPAAPPHLVRFEASPEPGTEPRGRGGEHLAHRRAGHFDNRGAGDLTEVGEQPQTHHHAGATSSEPVMTIFPSGRTVSNNMPESDSPTDVVRSLPGITMSVNRTAILRSRPGSPPARGATGPPGD